MKRTIGWEGQNKRPPCWWYAVLDPGACFLSFSLSLSLFFFSSPLAETECYSSSLSPLPLILVCSLHRPHFLTDFELSFLITRYTIHAHMPLWPLMDLFSINKFVSLTEANAVLQTEIILTANTSNFCWSRYKFPEGKISSPITFLMHSPQ